MKKIILILLATIFLFNIPITVLADDIEEEETNIIYEEVLNVSTEVDNIPKINSRACLIYDRDSKRVLFEKNGYSKRAMASTTKIMTAIIVLENANLNDTVEISKKAGGTRRVKAWIKSKRQNNSKRFAIWINDAFTEMMQQ